MIEQLRAQCLADWNYYRGLFHRTGLAKHGAQADWARRQYLAFGRI